MALHLAMAVLFALTGIAAAQEKEVPKDSERVSLTGCSRGRTFIVTRRSDPEPVRSDVEPGRRFRLSASKKILEEIKKQEGSFIEVTGLVRKSRLHPPAGVRIGGGGVQVGIGPVGRDPVAYDPRRDPLYNEAVIDLESWRAIPEACPARAK